ncbi:hypothetical protein AVEN_73475-1, partial [Araneus ventricosus]
MKLKGLGEECVNHGLFGGFEHAETHQRYRINLSNVEGSYNFELDVLDEKKICASLPKMNDAHCLNQLKDMGILISDATINERSCLYEKNPGEIHLLIGADYADSLGIKEDSAKHTKTETQELALEHFRETVSRDSTGRYKVNLPWLDGHPPLRDNKELAPKRLKYTVKSLKSKNRLNEYQEVFNQWENEGIIEQINPDKVNPEGLGIHYLPHRAVFKDNSTTKVRPVFDGSAKARNSVSINECIEKGPNLIEMIPAILNRFRWGKIGVISDIKHSFLQIALNESDRDVLRFMWWKDGDPQNTVTYRHCRVVFGISCRPFLLAAVLNHVLDQVEEPLRNLAMKLKYSLYVDNCVASVDSVSDLEHFRTETQRILKTAKFDLRGWKNNFLPEMEETVQDSSGAVEEKEVSVLGLTWDREEDTLSCKMIRTENEGEPITKRKILSVAHQLFDPIGFTCTITLIPKLLLQECWKLGISWDSKLPEDKQWYEGPPWLRDSRDKWPHFELSPDENIIYAEKKKTVVSSLNKKNDEIYNNISSYKKIIRITGWMYRFYENSKGLNKKSGELSEEEIKRAELKILKKIQEDSFHNKNTQRLKPLVTFIDADGILKTKLTMREEDRNFKVPIVLPSDHHVVKSLISYKHQELGHPGVQTSMVALRENYWILKSRRTIKKIIKTCIICQRFSVKQPEILEGTLPEDRVKNASIFEVIGVDVACPLIIKESKKVWILIITCAVYRAVHLELLMSLSTDNFILALRRFIARRGRPSTIYSDTGTNFIGMDNSLETINLRRSETSFTPITSKFIPPAAPWWGGFWERLICLLKRILRKVLVRTSLNYQEMETVLCDCESQLNSR